LSQSQADYHILSSILKFRQKSGRGKIDACRIGLNIAPESAVGAALHL
jgi:hypothetical protein